MANDQIRIARLERELQQLRNGIAQRPLIVPAPPAKFLSRILKIIDGQTVLASPLYYGIKKKASQITSVTSAFDPNGVAATPGLFTADDGIGRAYLITNGVLDASLVLVCHDTRTGALVPEVMTNGDYRQTFGTISLTVGTGTTTVTAYIPQPM